ncbi:MAG: endonuclease III [Spirochaetia bacterium]
MDLGIMENTEHVSREGEKAPPSAEWVIPLVEEAVEKTHIPSVSEVAGTERDPYKILISTVISLRTKDEVTIEASKRLFARAHDPPTMLRLDGKTVEELIYPAGFYRVKAGNILEISRILVQSHDGTVPDNRETLLKLPGVGLKTANLTLSMGYGLPYICVDTHVHRISNRLGWVSTPTPEKTEQALMEVLPLRYRIPINELFVRFGQALCSPVSPRCSLCPLSEKCPKIGVKKSR